MKMTLQDVLKVAERETNRFIVADEALGYAYEALRTLADDAVGDREKWVLDAINKLQDAEYFLTRAEINAPYRSE